MDKIRAGQARVLVICGVLAALLLGGGWLLTRPYARLGADGVVGRAVVTGVRHESGVSRVEVAYDVGGTRYQQSSPHAPLPVGSGVAVVYLPERPSIVWVERPPTAAEVAAVASPFRGGAGLFAWMAFGFLLTTEIALWRARRGHPESLVVIGGRFVWLLLTGMFVGVTAFDSASGEVLDRAFGLGSLGVPTAPVRGLAAFLIALPGAWTSADLFALVTASPPHAGGRFGLVLWLLSRGPVDAGLGAERTRTLATGFAYLALLLGWIAFAAARGV
jgi:hypothetical protein